MDSLDHEIRVKALELAIERDRKNTWPNDKEKLVDIAKEFEKFILGDERK